MPDSSLAALIAAILKVPPRPEPPAGSAGSLKVFNAAAGFYRYRLLGWAIGQAGTAAGLVVGLVLLSRIEIGPLVLAGGLIRVIEVLGVAGFLAQLPFSFLLIRLDYRYRWYMVTDTALRIREGLLTVREQTMTFANIQNLSIRRGPLQRFFGIADLEVRTAGGGERPGSSERRSEGADMHVGYFRGVDNAAEIRDLIAGRMRGLRDAGLGDPDESSRAPETAPVPAAAVDEMAAATRELRAEAARLRTIIGG
jgi:membrane protein YdbS with pleckstrin-like domain